MTRVYHNQRTSTESLIRASALVLCARAMASPAFPEPRRFDAYAPTPAQIVAVAESMGLTCVPCRSDPAFTARLTGHTIAYNALAHPRRQVLYLWHEIIEHLARVSAATLFDDDPAIAAARYDGAVWPADIRHRTARAAEALLIRAFPELSPAAAAKRRAEIAHRAGIWHREWRADPARYRPEIEVVAADPESAPWECQP